MSTGIAVGGVLVLAPGEIFTLESAGTPLLSGNTQWKSVAL
jgi:hypothetical protein